MAFFGRYFHSILSNDVGAPRFTSVAIPIHTDGAYSVFRGITNHEIFLRIYNTVTLFIFQQIMMLIAPHLLQPDGPSSISEWSAADGPCNQLDTGVFRNQRGKSSKKKETKTRIN